MEITLIIVGGLCVMTLIAVAGDYFAKKKKAVTQETVQRLQALEQQVQVLEARVASKDEQITRLDESVTFLNRLLEDKSRQ